MKHLPTITALSVLAMGCAVGFAEPKGTPGGHGQGQKPAPAQAASGSAVGSNAHGPAGPAPPAPAQPAPAQQPPPSGSPGSGTPPPPAPGAPAPVPAGLPQVPVPGGSPPPAGQPVAPPAPAATSTPPNPGTGIWNRVFDPPSLIIGATVTPMGDGFRLATAQFGDLMSQTTWPITWPAPADLPVQVQRTWTAAINGLDITYTITNTSGSAQPLPMLLVPGFNMENQLQWLFFTPDTHFTTLTWTSGTTTVAPDVRYPQIMYAPMLVAKDSRVALGVALKYPVLEYKHNIRMIFRKNADQTSWMTCVALDGAFPAGQTRTYGVTVRFMLPGDWIHTLEPYRDYLHAMYGELPHYTQDLRPVYARELAYVELQTPTNLRGFRPNFRSDLNGWTAEVDFILNYATTKEFERVMIWCAAGLHDQFISNNYPPQIMTHWTGPMMTSESQWARIPAAGIDLGFWWGNSARVADQWNDPTLEVFNIHNPTHVALKLPEAQLAWARGARTIGMDSFRMMDTWDAVPWLEQLSHVGPNLRFIGEPSSNDVMNMYQPLFGVSDTLLHAPLLHDYLIPGREIWVQLRGDEGTISRAEQCIGWGMTICVLNQTLSAHDVAGAVDAAQHGWVLSPDAETTFTPGPLYGD